MYTFILPDISCGHCAKAITNAITEADANAQVDVDINSKTVNVRSELEREKIAALLAEEGYQE